MPSDLFALTGNRSPVPVSLQRDEALARVVRAKNAALQRPLSYLDVSRGQFTADETKLFDEINPIQVAQYFLEKVSDSMIFGSATPTAEMRRIVCAYVERLDFSRNLTEDQRDRIVDKVIGALRNEQKNYDPFVENIRNEVTGEQIVYKFSLITVHSTIITGRDEHVYKLTQEGVKLLHLNWQAPDDFDMYGIMVETAMKSGKYTEAAGHIERCRLSSVKIEAALGDIELKLNQQSYDKDFADEISGLIDDVKAETASFGQVSQRSSSLVRLGNEAEDLDEAARQSLIDIAAKIRELQRIHARFMRMIGNVFSGFKRFQQRKIADSGTRYQVPDLTTDYLARMALLSKETIFDGGIADAITATVLTAKRPGVFDPFVLWETARLADEEEADEQEVDQSSFDIIPGKRTSIADITTSKRFLDSILKTYGKNGIRLSRIFALIDAQSSFSRELKFTVAHRAAFISQKYLNLHVTKIDDGTRLVDCPYVSGPDLLLKVEKA
jgi:hypothetical protein